MIKPKEQRIIKTARDENKINIAARNGFFPLVKKVISSDKITSKFRVIQNKSTGEIKVDGDYRADYDSSEYNEVIGWTYYYPYSFKSPFAAYLVPKNIKVGEKVFLEDLIEDIVGTLWNQGSAYRLESAEAIWNGTDFEIQFNPDIGQNIMIG
jgi:hypothetical protein